jgi:WD40 repeat protein
MSCWCSEVSIPNNICDLRASGVKIQRRDFLKASLAGAAGALLVGGCGGNSRTACNRNIGDAHTGSVLALAIDSSGTLLASGSADASVKLWSFPGGTLLHTLSGHRQAVVSLAIAPDGTLLASGSKDNTIKLWSLPDGALITTLSGHTNAIAGLAFSLDGKTLISGSADFTVKLWNLADLTLLDTLQGHAAAVRDIAISPDGTYVVSSSEDQTLNLWSLSTGALLTTLSTPNGWVNAMAFSPDGTALLTGCNGGAVILWTMPDCVPALTIKEYGDYVGAVAIAPDKSILASAVGKLDATVGEALDPTFRLWRGSDGALAKTIDDHQDYVQALAMSPDGTLLVSGSADKSIRLWQMPKGSYVRSASDPALPIRVVVSFSC